jgi:alkane 1-monooxygenase
MPVSVLSDRAATFYANLRTFVLHLLSFVLPLATLSFWLTGPHQWRESLLWTLPMITLYWLDGLAPADRRQPPERLAAWPYALQLHALFALQIVNHALLLVTASMLRFDSPASIAQTCAMLLPTIALGGINAGYSGVVVAHELVHRRGALEQAMGRVLLVCVLYEHFATEHIRGHHPRVGTAEDPATAHFGETHGHYLRRTIPAQWKSAWQLATQRLKRTRLRWYSPHMLRHRVLQGVVAEVALLFAIAYFFGPIAFVFFLVQTAMTILMLETVNYIEHWGLTRTGKKVVAADSWDAENWFTHYTLVGLARHSDHHAQASRPFQKLRHFEETAKMPSGYYSTILLAILMNDRYRAYATRELEQRQLGPFRAAAARVTMPLTHVHPDLQAPPEDSDAVA